MRYDLGYSRLEFSISGDSTLRAYDYFIIDGEIRFIDLKYSMKDSILRIRNSFFTKEFLISSLNDTQLCISSGGKQYLFTKIKSAKGILDSIPKRPVLPVFEGNLRKYIDKILVSFPANDISTSYQVSFKIDKTGAPDSITIKGMTIHDSLYSAIEVLLLTTKKWKPGKLNGAKEEMKVELDIYRMSALARALKAKNYQKLIEALFTLASRYYKYGDKSKALIYYKECISLFSYIASTEKYSPSLSLWIFNFIKETNIQAVMNSALIYLEAGDIKEACKYWVTVIDYDQEALALFNKYYKSSN